MVGNILAVKIGEEENYLTPYGAVFVSGFRAVLNVEEIWAKTQTTVFFGISLYLVGHDSGQMNPQQAFTFFLQGFYKKSVMWGQLTQPPPTSIYGQALLNLRVPQTPPTAIGTMTLLSSGYDPLRNYWLEFAGNYSLTSPIFKEWPNVRRDGLKTRGQQGN